jgi:TPR repeat protein
MVNALTARPFVKETTPQIPLEKLRQAAEQGHAEAQFRLGVMHGNGDEVDLDHAAAIHWFSQAARQGHESALINLAWVYANGAGVDIDENRARELYLLAANHGSAKAQYIVATMYRFAQYGVEKDLGKALEYYTQSANQGLAKAQLALGKLLIEEPQIEKNDMLALQWLSLAHANGDKKAEDYIKKLLEQMSPEDLAQAEQVITRQT